MDELVADGIEALEVERLREHSVEHEPCDGDRHESGEAQYREHRRGATERIASRRAAKPTSRVDWIVKNANVLAARAAAG